MKRKLERGRKAATTSAPAEPAAAQAAAASIGVPTAFLANLLVCGTFACAALLEARAPDLYYLSLQEDEVLEWASFWAFLVAAAVSLAVAIRQRRNGGGLPWFAAGVAAFCCFVALEEISWGQRLLGYRPPRYFLEHNFQQELNVHNVVATSYRKLALLSVIGGYGVALPLLALAGGVQRLLRRAGRLDPPLALIPAFFVTLVVYHLYPWRFTGEWVELALGLGFLFTAVVRVRAPDPDDAPAAGRRRQLTAVALSWLAVVGLGTASAYASRSQRAAHPENVEAARVEIEALRKDFLSGRVRTRCGLHRRLYTFVDRNRQPYLMRGAFAALTARGLPEERAEFLLDPWNQAYWVRDACSESRGRRTATVYSFGPNRRRDSTAWEVLGDDVGAVISSEPLDPEQRPSR